jgi:isopentenyl diphosphate isomerase/L-lactate dehydrogenase-like FMN-dependent dehydrogenase
VLPQIANTTNPEMTVMLDSGIRYGADIVKAYASGASFVFSGRSFMFGIGALNELGAEFVLNLMVNEVDKTLAQIGCKNIEDLDPEYIWHKN